MVQIALPEKQIQGNPLESHLRSFATSLMDSGYRDKTIQDKLYLLARFGWWFGQNKRVISQLDESLVDAFAKQKRRIHALLQHGVDRSVIALWLGHESVETTQSYLHADMQLKEKALSRTEPLCTKLERYRPNDQLLAFLERL